jgi:hypothetical protein
MVKHGGIPDVLVKFGASDSVQQQCSVVNDVCRGINTSQQLDPRRHLRIEVVIHEKATKANVDLQAIVRDASNARRLVKWENRKLGS